jgi:CheY-like chemotaxis protein
MATILVGTSAEYRSVVRAALRTATPDERLVFAESVQEIERATTEHLPDLIVVDHCFARSLGAASMDRLQRSDRRRKIIVLADRPTELPHLPPTAVVAGTDCEELSEAIRTALACRTSAAEVESPERKRLHGVRNRLAGLVISLRALGADLEEAAPYPDQVRALVEEYRARIEAILKDLSAVASSRSPERRPMSQADEQG